MKFVLGVLAAAFAFALHPIPGHASSCAEFTRIDNDEVKAMIALIKDPNADEFDQILAVEALTCAERKPIRDMAFRAMLRSPNDIARTDGVFRALADRQSIVVKLSTTDGMSREALDFVRANPELIYDNKFVDTAKRCVSLYYKDVCRPAHGVVVERSGITLRYDDARIKVILKSTPDGKLRGEFANRDFRVPAEIEVY